MRGTTETQGSILMHVNAYSTSIIPAIARDCCPEASIKAVEKKVIRLADRKFLQLVRDHGYSYVRLGPAAIKEFRFSSHRTKLPGPESLPRDLAIVRHCVLSGVRRDRLSMAELKCIFKEFPDHLAAVPFYIDSERNRLVAMYVLGCAPADQFLDRLDAERQRFVSAGGTIAKLMRDNRLSLDVITQDLVRKREVEQLLPPSPPIAIEVFNVPSEPRMEEC